MHGSGLDLSGVDIMDSSVALRGIGRWITIGILLTVSFFYDEAELES